MQKTIELQNKKISYMLRVSNRAKYMRLVVQRGGDFFVTVPYGFGVAAIEQFLVKKATWIVEAIDYALKFTKPRAKDDPKKYHAYREQARTLVHARVQHFNKFYGQTIGRISIRNQKSRWGSCSLKGNLNFNYRIALLPTHLADYIVIHELCHLVHFNHSSKFWGLVSQTFPEHKSARAELRRISIEAF